MLALKELRLAQNMSQSELAKKVGCNQTAIGKYERGQLEPNLRTLKQFAEIFNVSVDYLIGRTESDERQIDLYKNTFYTSSEEQEIIKAYRQLSFDQQQVIKVQLGALVEVNK